MPQSAEPRHPRRFPAPWSVQGHAESFSVHDATGFAIVYVYFSDGRRFIGTGPERMTRDEARRIAVNVARLPELLGRGP